MRAIESVSDQLQHAPENKTQEVEEEKTKSHKVVKTFVLSKLACSECLAIETLHRGTSKMVISMVVIFYCVDGRED